MLAVLVDEVDLANLVEQASLNPILTTYGYRKVRLQHFYTDHTFGIRIAASIGPVRSAPIAGRIRVHSASVKPLEVRVTASRACSTRP